MNLDRLNHLKTVMRRVSEQRLAFDMSSWVDHIDKDEWDDWLSASSGILEATCGTTCCAMGWSALDPEFQKQGLEMAVRAGGETEIPATLAELNRLLKSRDYEGVDIRIRYDGSPGEYAAVRFFDISHSAAYYLFMPQTYDDILDHHARPEDVIERVDEVIRLNGCSPDEVGE